MNNKFISGKVLFKILLICFILEIFVFNFKHFESYFFEDTSNYKIFYSSGIKKISEGVYEIVNSEKAYFEITELDVNVKNLYINFLAIGEGRNLGEKLPVVIEMTDEANAVYRTLPETEVVNKIKESRYIRLHLSGKSSKLKINIRKANGDLFGISEIGINKNRPIVIHPIRISAIFILGVLFVLFRSSSELYNIVLNYKEKRQRNLICIMVLLHILLFVIIGFSALPFIIWERDTWAASAEYEDLANALIDGHFYLEYSPPQYLKEMENPYDPLLRDIYQEETGEEFLWDFAYRNGRYYCYFGIVPALIFFVPFKLLTGINLRTWIPVLLCVLLYCIGSFFFIYELIKKYYSKASVGIYLLLASTYVASSEVLYLAHCGNVYAMPIALGLLLGVVGMGCWIRTSRMPHMRTSYLILGATCIALIIGCRPQLAVILLFAFPIFGKQIKNQEFFSKKGFKNTCCILGPFFLVGIGIMYYNFARFGNPLDFGANYNLTGNDMTHRGIDSYRNFLGIYEYLFQPLNIKSKFPFIETIQLQMEYQGHTSVEPLLGGYFFTNIISVFSFGVFKCKNSLKQHGAYGLACASFLSAIIIVLITIQMSGLTQRYMCDFGWLLMISTILVILDLHERLTNLKEISNVFLNIIIVSSVISIIINYFSLFAIGRYYSIVDINPYMYYMMKYIFFKC